MRSPTTPAIGPPAAEPAVTPAVKPVETRRRRRLRAGAKFCTIEYLERRRGLSL